MLDELLKKPVTVSEEEEVTLRSFLHVETAGTVAEQTREG